MAEIKERSGDSLGDRMKGYEAVSSGALTRRCPVIVRVDGKAFHSWTRGMEKPFDRRLVNWMREATQATARAMQGCVLAYVQSDEASFLLTDWKEDGSQPWMGYALSKVVSLSAATFTACFNMATALVNFKPNGPAIFDARAFNVPREDVANCFLWRAKDWRRNSIQGLAQAHFSAKQLHGVSMEAALNMLMEKGVDWNFLDSDLRCGSFFFPSRWTWAYDVEPHYKEVAAVVDAGMEMAESREAGGD